VPAVATKWSFAVKLAQTIVAAHEPLASRLAAAATAAGTTAAGTGMDAQLVLVFGSVEHFSADGFVEALRDAFPGSALAGCTTAGEIAGGGVLEGTCVVTPVRFEHTSVHVAETGVDTLADSRAAGERLGTALARPDLAAVLLFGPGVDVNGTALIEGIVERIGTAVPISGGLAGDGGAFRRTFTLSPSGVSDRRAVAIGLYGDRLNFGHGSFGGWQPFGPTRKVTRAEGSILYELDGEPALNIYKRYLGDYAKDLPASGLLFPFEMLDEDHTAVGLIRTILGVDEATGSLVLAGSLIEGGYLRLMHASTDALVEGAENAARAAAPTAAAPTASGPALALLVSCVGRKLVMGDQVDEEVEAVADLLGAGATLAGFYSYGEINPVQGAMDCKLHNQTMTVAVLSER
jgi:hypothetical protein